MNATTSNNEVLFNAATAIHDEITKLMAQREELCKQMGVTTDEFITTLGAKRHMEKEAVATKQDDNVEELFKQADEIMSKPIYNEPAPKKASRVKRSKQVDTIVEKAHATKRDVNAGDAQRIDATKEAAKAIKPAKVAQEKRSTKKSVEPKSGTKQVARNYEGMSYAEVRSQVSERKAKLNKADVERMAKANLKNNTWEGAIASLEYLNRYFPIAK